MLAAAKAGIYRSPGERLALPTMAGGCLAEGLLKPPARLGIVEDLRSPLDYHLLNDIDNGVEIIESFERQRGGAPLQISGRSAAVLRRTRAVAIDTDRIGLTRIQLQPVLDPD